MREIKTWHRGLRQTVQKAWGPEGVGRPSERLCEVELGLYAWEILMPQENPRVYGLP